MANGRMARRLPHQSYAQYPVAKSNANQRKVSRMAGPSRRSSSCRIVAFGTGVLYQVASASPLANACSEFSLLNRYRFSANADMVVFPPSIVRSGRSRVHRAKARLHRLQIRKEQMDTGQS